MRISSIPGTMILLLSLTALILSSHVVSGEGLGVFELRLKNYVNSMQKNADGQCCEGFETASGLCTGLCVTRFRVCLKHYQARIDLSSSSVCTFGESLTPVLSNNIANLDVISFPLDFKWPGTFSLIIEALHESNLTQGGRSLISQVAVQERLDAGEMWTSKLDREGHTLLEYEYRLICSAHYFGKDCDTLCRPRNDQFGHYTCNAEGQKTCLPGWQKDATKPEGEGDYCTKAVCAKGCHPEHGKCDVPGKCQCKSGYEGENCDKCVLYPGCVHGSCQQPHQCLCNEGWGGLFCNQDLNYCTNHKPCRNGATCRNTGQGSYTCSCPPGYTGTNCESRISNECDHQPCLNGGTCQGSGVNNYTCVCPLGFHGHHCEMRAQTCADQPCKNGASCYNTRDGGYQCKCLPEFQGVNCDVKIDHCRATPCLNGGTCSLTGPDTYECKCPTGFSGNNCQINVDECAGSPCQNGGTCFDFVNDYKCYCHAGFVGKNCEKNVNDCITNPCANGGTCHDYINDFKCACPPGFTGKHCSQEINECASSPCMHGFCVDKLNDFECKCLPGYSGKHCNVLPDGTVLPLEGQREDGEMDGGQVALIVACSFLVPLLVIIAAILLWCNKQKQRREQRRADAEARKENELNAVNCMSKSKMLDDHMIVNPLDYPKQKSVNTNPNIADEELFSAKDSAYAQKARSNLSSRASMMLCDKLENSSVVSSTPSFVDKPRLSNLPSSALRAYESSSSSTLSSGASSVCSSESSTHHSKEYGLPTASSISQAASGATVGPSSSPYRTSSSRDRRPSPSPRKTYKDDLFATEV